jgi:Tfp pilus assembly protein PilF
MRRAAAVSLAENAQQAMRKGDASAALPLAQQAVSIDPTVIMGHFALGNALNGVGRKDEARREWQLALDQNRQLDQGAQTMFGPGLEARLRK